MKCDECRKTLTKYLTEQVGSEKRRSMDSHLKNCASCRRQLEQFRRTWEALGTLPEEEPGPDLKERFYIALEAAKRDIQSEKRRTVGEAIDGWMIRFLPWLLPKRPVFQGGLALVMLVFGIVLGTGLTSRMRGNGDMAALRDEMRSMRQAVTLSLLDRPSSVDRLRGVQYSKGVESPSQTLLSAMLETLRSDPNVNVRLAAVDALFLFRNEEGVRETLLAALTEETSPLVQIAVIDLLVGIREQRALQALRTLLEDSEADPTVKAHARERIGELS